MNYHFSNFTFFFMKSFRDVFPLHIIKKFTSLSSVIIGQKCVRKLECKIQNIEIGSGHFQYII